MVHSCFSIKMLYLTRVAFQLLVASAPYSKSAWHTEALLFFGAFCVVVVVVVMLQG